MRRHKVLTSFFLMGIVFTVACGGDDGSAPPPPDPPVVTGVSPTTVSPGDTVTITGSNFSDVAGENTVTFRNPTSARAPFQASENELRVVVDRDATDGPLSVATAGGSDTGDTLAVVRGVGDVFVFGGVGANNVLSLPNPTVNTRYLVVPHGTSTAVDVRADLSYTIETTTGVPLVAGASHDAQAAGAPHAGPHAGPNDWFESQRWEGAAETYRRYGAPREVFDREPALSARVAPAFRQFYVLQNSTGDQNAASSYARITAQLKYDGTKCLVYADVETLTTGNFTQTHFNQFGQTYDNSVEATNATYFGGFSDVDGNDRVILLVSPVVNRLEEPGCTTCSCGFIAGFFNPRDLYASPPVPAGTTNHAEVLYLLAADPTGVWDCQFDVEATASENLGTIPHEHQHLTSFSHRLFYQGGTFQLTWLEEGMAHMAEDLNGDNSSNIGRGKLYREDPGAISLEDSRATLEQRGGIYLMMRLLCDRYGTGILKSILQSKCTGRACIQNVTGMGFYDVFAEFLAAQYLSGTGVTSDDRFNYSSIDIDDFGPLLVGVHAAGGLDVSSTVRRSGGDFHVFTGVLGMDSRFQFSDPEHVGLRSVIVRIQ